MRGKIIFIGIVILCVVALGYAYERTASLSPVVNATQAPLASSTPETREITDGERVYENHAFHFGLIYPDTLQVTEYKERGGALTVTFANADNSKAFQVFVTPYDKQQIDQTRFKLDEPSGVMNDPTAIIVDGAHATMFFGRNAVIGDTREVWFINKGLLYEVTTYKPLDSWLSQIMATWKFVE